MDKTKGIIDIAKSRGSSATTYAGAWRYLLAHLPAERFGARRGSDYYERSRWTEDRDNRRADGRARVLGYSTNDRPDWVEYCDAYQADHTWERQCSQRLARDGYGAIYVAPRDRAARPGIPREYNDDAQLIDAAQASGAIEDAHDGISFDRRSRADGTALQYEMYDFAPGAALVCARRTEGSRYGVKTLGKSYLLIERVDDRSIRVTPTEIPVAKLAKTSPAWGAIIARVRGDASACKLPSSLQWQTAYKAVAVDGDQLRSIYSGEEYALGKLAMERARDNHSGGYYCYRTPEEACQASVPTDSKCKSLRRVVVRCAVAGRRIQYDGGKIARTYLRPVEIIASIL